MVAFTVIRVLIGAGGLALFGLGLLLLVGGGPPGAALWLLFIGGCGIIVVLLERQRYRSEAAERSGDRAGPGGGEPVAESLPPQFEATEERFVDPTTNRLMRVYLDPRTGERRYRAE